MPSNFLSPGLAYLSRATLTLIILPLVALWILQSALAKSGFDLPFVLTGFAIRRDANRIGALLLPSVEENSVSILNHDVDKFKNGYPGEAFHMWSEQYGHTFSFGSLSDRRVFTTEPEHVKAILATQFQDFEKGFAFAESPVVCPLINAEFQARSSSLLLKRLRAYDTSVITYSWQARCGSFIGRPRGLSSTRIVFLTLITLKGTQSARSRKIQMRLREGYLVDFQDIVSRFTMDSATEYLFGKDVNSIAAGLPYPAGSVHFINHPSNSFVKAFAKAQEQTSIRTQKGPSWPLSELWADKVQPLREVINDFVQPMLSEALDRKANGVKSMGWEKDLESTSLLDRLVHGIDNPKVVQDELINILIAGRDTTSSLLTFAVYMICEHPDMVSLLRSEILEKVATGKPTYDDIRDMKYLRGFLNGYKRSGAFDPPKHSPALEFDPDRFLDSRVHKYLTPNPFIFAPFNAGPRIRLGQQFAYNEASYCLIRLLQTFSSFSLAMDAQPPEGIPPKSWTRTPETTKGREKIMLGRHVTLYAKVFSGPSPVTTTHAVDPYIAEKKMSSSPKPEPVGADTALTFLTHRSASLGDLLRTNLPPSEGEANLRETELSDTYKVLEKLDQEIEQVEIALSLLKSKKKDIWAIIRKYKRVLSPANNAEHSTIAFGYYHRYLNSESYGLLDALSVHSDRWTAVSFNLSDENLAELRDIRGALGSLQSLKIEMQEVHERTLEKIDAFEFAPRLTHLKLLGGSDEVNFVFPWHQLISFCEEPSKIFPSGEFPSSLLGVLQKCERLQEFTIPTSESFPNFDLNDLTYVVHISLTHLIVKNRSLLPCLTFPSLYALSLDQNDYTGPEAISDVCDLISRSSCSLTELCFDGFSPEPVIELLEQYPNLRRLSFSYRPGEWRRHVDNEFMELAGSRTNGHPGFLCSPDSVPRLQSLSITIDNDTALKVRCMNGDFVDRIKSRWRPGNKS
ncbi:cytochrome P450 [Armillaria fumosa]|nr:cytochrome P450 [Armillaria fumosa]